MNVRGSVVKFSVFTALAVLASSLLLFAAFRITKISSRRDVSGRSAVLGPQVAAGHVSDSEKSKALKAYGQLPLSFMENQGQTAQPVRYLAHGSQYDLFLTSQEAVVTLRKAKRYDLSGRHRAQTFKALRNLRKAGTTTAALRLQFDGANPSAQIAGDEKLPGVVNYYIGNDPQKWHKNIPTYAQVKYREIYPGVDLVFYGNQRRLEYDFILAPGADPNVIRMNVAGARKLQLDAQGNVLLAVNDGQVRLQKPVIYQEVDGQRREVSGRYALAGHRLSFAVGKYDHSKPLVLDPILNYSTYLGGSADEAGYAIALDGSGDAYIGGGTDSSDFPLAGAGTLTSNPTPVQYGFVSELNPTGTALLVSGYLGGSAGGDSVFAIALDPSGNVYVTGITFATDFPTTTNGLKPTLSANANGTSFLAASNTAGTMLYSTYLGGNQGDFGNGVVADANGNAYVTGVTYSAAGTTDVTFPVSTGAYQSALPDSSGSAFLTRIDTTKSGTASLIYSTYLGGDGANAATADLGFGDEGYGVALDGSNHAYISGTTTSSDFPVSTNAFQAAPKVGNDWSSAFLTEIDTTQSGNASLVYSTYVGGSGDASANDGNGLGEFGTNIALQSGTTVAYMTGTTDSADYPTTTGAYQTTGDAANGSAFLTVIDTSAGSALKYSTFLGTSGTTGYGIQVDKTSGTAVLSGGTSSSSLPVTSGAYQNALASGAPGDAFIAEINPAGGGASDLLYLSYFGGSGGGSNPDQSFGLAFNTLPTVYITGQTFSSNLPSTSGAFQTALSGPSDAFVAELNLTTAPLTISATSLSFTSTAVGTATAAQTVTLTNNTNNAITFTGATVISGSPAAADTDFAATTACTSIPALGTCTVSLIYTPSVSTTETATLSIVDGAGTQTVALTGNVGVTPPDFGLTSSPSLVTVKKGGTATFTITVTPIAGFNSAVALACSGAPRRSTCSLAPASVTPADGVTSVNSTLTVTTESFVAPPATPRYLPPVNFRIVIPAFAALLMLSLMFLSERRFRTRLGLAAATLVFVALAGCGSSGGTPKGSYSITVTGASGSISHSVTVQVVVD